MSATAKLEQWLREAAAMGASDVYLVPGEPLTVRIDGQIQRTEGDIVTAADIDEMAVPVFGEERIAAYHKSFARPECLWSPAGETTYGNAARSVRMLLTRSYGKDTIYVQLSTPAIVDVKHLRVPEAILKAALSPSGLIVFAGRLGSGRSTTAYSVVDYINANRACHIFTVERGMYQRFTSKKALVQQHEIGGACPAEGGDAPSETWLFHTAIGQDVDVFFMNIILDMEAMNVCIAAAERHWLVVAESTVEVRPQEILERFIVAYPVDQQPAIAKALAKHVGALCCQKLLPCARGGRVAAYAVLIPDEEMRRAFAEGRDPMQRQSPMPPECQTMEQAIQRLLDEGDITAETAAKALADLN
jgi:twitching motility protein PilT